MRVAWPLPRLARGQTVRTIRVPNKNSSWEYGNSGISGIFLFNRLFGTALNQHLPWFIIKGNCQKWPKNQHKIK